MSIRTEKSRIGFESIAKTILFWLAIFMTAVLFYQVAQRVIYNHQVQQQHR